MKRLMLVFFTLASALLANAQISINDIISKIPNEIAPYLNNEQKTELGKFAGNNDTIAVKNMLNGTTTIDSINSSYARIKLSNTSDIQIKLLPLNDSSQVICVIKTLKKPVADSKIMFYTAGWERINNNFGLPINDTTPTKILDELTASPDTMSSTRFIELRNLLEPVIMSAEFIDEDNVIKFSLSLPLLNSEEKESVRSIVKQKSFKWDGEIFNYF